MAWLNHRPPASALFNRYVDPPDPFAEPVPVEMYRMSDDAKTPNLRLILKAWIRAKSCSMRPT